MVMFLEPGKAQTTCNVLLPVAIDMKSRFILGCAHDAMQHTNLLRYYAPYHRNMSEYDALPQVM